MRSKIFIGLLILVTVTSCKKAETNEPAPIAGFTVQNPHAELNEGAALKLTNTSSCAKNVSYLWDFGNGKTSSEKEPSAEFGMHGDYSIKLTVTDNMGRSSTTVQTVKVLCVFATINHPPLF